MFGLQRTMGHCCPWGCHCLLSLQIPAAHGALPRAGSVCGTLRNSRSGMFASPSTRSLLLCWKGSEGVGAAREPPDPAGLIPHPPAQRDLGGRRSFCLQQHPPRNVPVLRPSDPPNLPQICGVRQEKRWEGTARPGALRLRQLGVHSRGWKIKLRLGEGGRAEFRERGRSRIPGLGKEQDRSRELV